MNACSIYISHKGHYGLVCVHRGIQYKHAVINVIKCGLVMNVLVLLRKFISKYILYIMFVMHTT